MIDTKQAIHTLSACIAPYVLRDRVSLLTGLLAQEIANFPARHRQAELATVIDDLPDHVDMAVEDLRHALAENARAGL